MSRSKSWSKKGATFPTLTLVSVIQALLVGEYLSFRRVATVLGVRQSAVSRRVRELEDELGVSLFERHHAGVRVTNAGARFLQEASPSGSRTARLSLRVETLISMRFMAQRPSQSSACAAVQVDSASSWLS